MCYFAKSDVFATSSLLSVCDFDFREHVSTVMDVLRNTLIVVTRRTTCTEDMTLNEKMMELRNHIICGGSTFRFVPLKDLGLLPGYSSYGFLGEHGKYESCIMVRSC